MSGAARAAPGAHRPGFAGVTDGAARLEAVGVTDASAGRAGVPSPCPHLTHRPLREAASADTAPPPPRRVQGLERRRHAAGLQGMAGDPGRCGLWLELLRAGRSGDGTFAVTDGDRFPSAPGLPVSLPVSFPARVLALRRGSAGRDRRLRLRAERPRGSSRPRAPVSRAVCVVGGKEGCSCQERRHPRLVFARNSRARPVQIRKVDFPPFSQKRGQHLESQNLGMRSLSATLRREGDVLRAASQPATGSPRAVHDGRTDRPRAETQSDRIVAE